MSQLRAGAILSYLQLALSNVAGLLVTPVLLRHLGVSGYGVYALVGSLVAYFTVLDLGLGSTIVRYVARYRAQRDREGEARFVSLCLLVYCAIALVVLAGGAALYAHLDRFFGPNMSAAELGDARVMFALLIANVALSFPLGSYSSYLGGHERFVFLRAFAVVRIVVRAVLVVVLLKAGYRAVAVVVVDTVLNVSTGLVSAVYAHGALRLRLRAPRRDLPFAREIFAFSVFVFLNIVVDQVYWRIGHLVLGAMVGPSAVAVFAISTTFVTYYIHFSTAFSGVLLPKVTRMVTLGASAHDLTVLFSRVGRAQLLVLAYVLGGFALFGQDFIGLWAGPEYEDAWLPAMILMAPLTIPLIQNVGIAILQARNQHAFRAIAYTIVAAANVALTFVAVGRWGVLGAAFGTTASLVVGNVIVMNWYYRRRLGLDVRRFFTDTLGLLGRWAAIAVGLAWPLRWIAAPTWSSLAARALAFSLVYGVVMWRYGLNAEEKRDVRAMLGRLGAYRLAS